MSTLGELRNTISPNPSATTLERFYADTYADVAGKGKTHCVRDRETPGTLKYHFYPVPGCFFGGLGAFTKAEEKATELNANEHAT